MARGKPSSPPSPPPALLQGWVHSHEEDSGEDVVFRPAGFAFPPSRGRAGFTLKAGGGLERHAPGATDRPVKSHGSWRMRGTSTLELYERGDTAPSAVWEIVSAGKDRLVLRRVRG